MQQTLEHDNKPSADTGPPPGTRNDDALEHEVDQRRIRRLLDSATATLIAGFAVACVVCYAIYRVTFEPVVLYWLAAIALLTVARVVWLRTLRRHAVDRRLVQTGRLYAVSAFLAGLLWATLITLDNPELPVTARLLILITVVAIPVSSISANAIYAPVFYAFSVPLFAAMVAWAWWFNPVFQIEFSAVAIAYIGLVVTVANRYNDNLKRSIEREIENERLLHEVRQMNAELQRLAFEDPLTGLSNRRSFENTARQLLQRLRSGDALALMLIDIDNFKWINDTLGHAAGDQALVNISQRIDRNSRLSEMVMQTHLDAARIGGDEFIVLYRLDPEADITPLATRILDAVTAPMRFDETDYLPSVSIGVALAPSHARSLDDLLRLADNAMYQAKKDGGSRFVLAAGSGLGAGGGPGT